MEWLFVVLIFIELFVGLCFSELRDLEVILKDIRDLLKEDKNAPYNGR